MNSKMKSKGKTWSGGINSRFPFAVNPTLNLLNICRQETQNKMKFSAKVNLFYNNRPASLKNFAFLVKHAYLSFTHFRVIDCTLLSYLVNCPFSYNTFFFLYILFLQIYLIIFIYLFQPLLLAGYILVLFSYKDFQIKLLSLSLFEVFLCLNV